MPGDHHYDPESGVFVTCYWGEVSLADILGTIEERNRDRRLEGARASVIDITNAWWAEVPVSFTREKLDRLRPALAPPAVHTVFVAPMEFWYGFVRMYAIVHEIYGGSRIDVVRSWPEAAEAVGRDLSQAEAWSRLRATADAETRHGPAA
ncbi:MAG TPA: hypothetical protein VID50_06985 [Candidatus Eisenbacteria bacterium]|jgi:hypothetical protein